MGEKIWIRHGTYNVDAKINLLCFPYAGGSPGIFAEWAKDFKEDINLCPVLYPGRDLMLEEPMIQDIKLWAGDFVRNNEELFHKSFAVLGYCAGGLFAYESILYAKQLFDRSPMFFLPISFATPMFKMSSSEICATTEDGALIKYLLENHIIDEDCAVDEDFLEYYLPIIRGDLKAVDAYDYNNKKEIDCDIYAFYGKEDTMFCKEDKCLWEQYTKKKVTIQNMEGGHYCLEKNKDFMISFIKNIKRNY